MNSATDEALKSELLSRLRERPNDRDYLTCFGHKVREFLSAMVDEFSVTEQPGNLPCILRLTVTTRFVLPKEARDYLLEIQRNYLPFSICVEWTFVESEK